MPECDVCGSEEFELVDGLYYCTECQTQTQHIVEAVEGEEYQSGAYSLYRQLEIRSQVPQEKTRKKDEDKGRPWKSHEAFQIIIKEQVKVLITLGASQQLKDVVFQLWMQYLSKLGVAFNSDVHKYGPAGNVPHPKMRDIYPGSMENPDIISHRHMSAWKRKYSGMMGKSTSQIKEREEIVQMVANEEFYEGDNPLAEEDQDFDMDEQIDKETLRKIYNQVEMMSLGKTLAFCYLGLLYTKHAVTPADIIRWVESGKIPFMNVASVLPENMKIATFDKHTFCDPVIPNEKRLRKITGQIASFLGATNFSIPKPEVLVSSFVTKLNLPGELHVLVHKLLEVVRPEIRYVSNLSNMGSNTRYSIPDYSTFTMAYIVIALKLLFGLNDFTERELSSYARELGRKVSINQELFVWEEWVCALEHKSAIKKKSKLPEKLEDVAHILKVEDCLNTPSVSKGKSKNIKINDLFISNRSETKEQVAKSISMLLKEMDPEYSAGEAAILPTEPGPAHREWDPLDDLLYGSQMPSSARNTETLAVPNTGLHSSTPDIVQPSRIENRNGEESQEKCDYENGKDFSKTTLSYILDGTNFLEHRGTHGLAEFTVRSALNELGLMGVNTGSYIECSSDVEGEVYEDRSNSNEHQEGNSQPMKKHQTTTPSTQLLLSAISMGLKWGVGSAPSEDSKIAQLAKRIAHMHGFYVQYNREGARFHLSYEWLLKTCCKLIETTPEILHRMVWHLELILVGTPRSFNRFEKLNIHNYLNPFFYRSIHELDKMVKKERKERQKVKWKKDKIEKKRVKRKSRTKKANKTN